MKELSYPGNLGVIEMTEFMEKATPEQKKQFWHLLKKKDYSSAMSLVQQVTKTKLQPTVGPEKKSALMAFDFDNTLVVTDSRVLITHSNGSKESLDSHEYAQYRHQPGDTYDFSEFNKVINPRRIEKYQRLLRAAARNPRVDVVIVTARKDAHPVADYLRGIGITGGVKIKALGTSAPEAKFEYLKNRVAAGSYQDLYFYDDSEHNAETVAQINKQFPQLGVRVHAHIVPPSEYRPLAGQEKPSPQRKDLQQVLMTRIPNPETGNQILVRSALKYDRNHPVYQIARQYLSRVIRGKG